MSRIVIRKGQEIKVRGKRFKVLDTNTYGGKYRYIVQDVSNGRITSLDRDVAVAAVEIESIRQAKHGATSKVVKSANFVRQKVSSDYRVKREPIKDPEVLSI